MKPLELERVDELVFRGRATNAVPSRIFGGQLVAHALLAGGATVPDGLTPHSLHGYFLRPGDPGQPVDYTVAPLRDGRTLSTRQVVGRQGGHEVFGLMASFHIDEDGLTHQLPGLTPFEPADSEDFAPMLQREDPDSVRWFELLQSVLPFEIRFAAVPARLAVRRGERPAPSQQVFIRWPELDANDPLRHAAAVAFMSDALLLSTSLFPHGRLLDQPGVRASSLDHSIWFHRLLRAGDWHLYRMDSSWAGRGRALCRGRLYETSGELAATVMQEGLVRVDP